MSSNFILDLNDSFRAEDTSRRERAQGSELVAQGNKALFTGSLSVLQQVEKDVIVPADPSDRMLDTTLDGNESSSTKPSLEDPYLNWSGLTGAAPIQEGLISILGRVLEQQARQNSRSFSNNFIMAVNSMMAQMKLAPVIANSIRLQYQNQSDATKCEAESASKGGGILLAAAVGGLAFGVVSDLTSTEEAEQAAVGARNETAVSEEANTAAPAEEQELAQAEELSANPNAEEAEEANPGEEASSRINNSQRNSWGNKIRSGGKFMYTKMGLAYQRLGSILRTSVGTVQMAEALAQGSKSLFVDAKYKGQEAVYQGQEGQNAANVEQLRTESSLANQRAEQSSSLWQRSGQDFDSVLSILRSAADTVTNTVVSMFRG